MSTHHAKSLSFGVGRQASVNRSEWRPDYKWSAAKADICSQTLLRIRIRWPEEPRQQSRTRKGHGFQDISGKSASISGLISESHRDNGHKTPLFCQRLQTAVSQQVMEESLRSACRLFSSSVGCGTAQHNPDARANKAQQSLHHVWTQNWMFWHCGCLRPQMGVTTRAKAFQNTKTWDQFRTHGTVTFGKWQHERLWLKLITHYAPPFVVDYRLYEVQHLTNEDILLSL